LLALDRGADALLIDDAEGRREAERRQIRVAGTLVVPDEAARKGLVKLPVVLERLRKTNFRVSSKLISQLLSASRSGSQVRRAEAASVSAR
jgi:predicted nucleic acid-binding protein